MKVVETSGWLKNVPCRNTDRKGPHHFGKMSHVFALRGVKENIGICFTFSNIVNFQCTISPLINEHI